MRYFRFTYEIYNNNGRKISFGTLHVDYTSFPSKQCLEIAVYEDNVDKFDKESTTIHFTGWKEFDTKQDYDDWQSVK